MRRYLQFAGIFVPLAVMVVGFGFTAPTFLSTNNLTDILVQGAQLSILAAGVTVVVLLGEVDLSIAAVQSAASAFVAALIVKHGVPVGLAVILALAAGLAVGVLNGYFAYFWRIPSFVVTLAMLGACQGAALFLTNSRTISGFPDSFLSTFGDSGSVGPVPAPVVIAGLVYLALWVLLTQTRFGVAVYAIGGSRSAAKRAGIPVGWVTVLAFGLSGLLSALAGLLLSARVDAANPLIGKTDLLDAIAVVVIGGASLYGGAGRIMGTLGGVLVITTLRTGLILAGVAAYWQEIAVGLAIVGAVTLDQAVQGRIRLPPHVVQRVRRRARYVPIEEGKAT